VRVQIWAEPVPDGEADRYTGELSLCRAVTEHGMRTVAVFAADPMVRISQALIEVVVGPDAPVTLFSRLRIDTPDGPLIYIVRGVDTDTGMVYLSWPD